MSIIKFQIKDATFEADTAPEALYADEEMLGECLFIFQDELADRLGVVTLEEYNAMGEGYSSTMDERNQERSGEEEREPGEDLELGADGSIGCLAYLADLGPAPDGEPWRFMWKGSGSVFWLFHDIIHAREDFSADAGQGHTYGPSAQLTSYEEDRANLEGAKLALAAGVSPDEVCEQLAGLAPAFLERFGDPSTALDDLLKSGVFEEDETTSAAAYASEIEGYAKECAEAYEDNPGDLHGDEHTPENPDFPTWAILTHSEYVEDAKQYEPADLDALAFCAMSMDVAEAARELLTCPECEDDKKVEAETCEDCADVCELCKDTSFVEVEGENGQNVIQACDNCQTISKDEQHQTN